MDQSVKSVDLQVLLDLPVKSEVILYTGLSALQKKLYKAGKSTRVNNYSVMFGFACSCFWWWQQDQADECPHSVEEVCWPPLPV